MAITETISTLNRSKNNYQDIRNALETKLGHNLENVHVENYKDLIGGLYKAEVVGKKLYLR